MNAQGATCFKQALHIWNPMDISVLMFQEFMIILNGQIYIVHSVFFGGWM